LGVGGGGSSGPQLALPAIRQVPKRLKNGNNYNSMAYKWIECLAFWTANLARCLSIVVSERSMLVATARGSSHSADTRRNGEIWQAWMEPSSRNNGTIELTDGNQVAPTNRYAEARDLGLTGTLCGPLPGARNWWQQAGRLAMVSLKTAKSITHINPPHCRRGTKIQLMHDLDE
jgi:hypothetical protein